MEVKQGVASLAVVPMRKAASESAEMVSQLLFGESFHILEANDKWYRIETRHDCYEGWIDRKMAMIADPGEKRNETPPYLVYSHFAVVIEPERNIYPMYIPAGSVLTSFDKTSGQFEVGGKKYELLSGQVEQSSYSSVDMLLQTALTYLNAPYLWGGRHPMGVDCSGFVQQVFRLNGIALPRDAKDQVAAGTPVDAIEKSNPGDLAFFENETGNIVHVGIVRSNHSIIHASGNVRIDTLDSGGIYNAETGEYTHRLSCIKRIVE